jgi:hypothetical protein
LFYDCAGIYTACFLNTTTAAVVEFFKPNVNDQVKEDEIGRVCSTNEGEEECM